jgi:hypothetical protein
MIGDAKGDLGPPQVHRRPEVANTSAHVESSRAYLSDGIGTTESNTQGRQRRTQTPSYPTMIAAPIISGADSDRDHI